MRGIGEKRWLSTYRVEGAEGSFLGTGDVVCRYGASLRFLCGALGFLPR